MFYIYPNEPFIEWLQLMFNPEEKKEIFLISLKKALTNKNSSWHFKESKDFYGIES